jgi:transposase
MPDDHSEVVPLLPIPNRTSVRPTHLEKAHHSCIVCTMKMMHTMASEANAPAPKRRLYSPELKNQVVAQAQAARRLDSGRGAVPRHQRQHRSPLAARTRGPAAAGAIGLRGIESADGPRQAGRRERQTRARHPHRAAPRRHGGERGLARGTGKRMRRLDARAAAVIRIDAVWLAIDPLDMRAGTDTALAGSYRSLAQPTRTRPTCSPTAGPTA